MGMDRLRKLSASLEHKGISAEEFFAQSDEAIDAWLKREKLGMTLNEVLREAVELSDEDLDAVSGGLSVQDNVVKLLVMRRSRGHSRRV